MYLTLYSYLSLSSLSDTVPISSSALSWYLFIVNWYGLVHDDLEIMEI